MRDTTPERDGLACPGNPFDPSVAADPYGFYALLRQRAPVSRLPDGSWLVAGHADAVAVLTDPRFDHWGQGQEGGHGGANADSLARCLRRLAPGPGQPLRHAVSQGLTAEAIDGLMAPLARRADRLLDHLCRRDRFDVLGDYAHPLFFWAIAHLIGLDETQSDAMTRAAADMDGAYLSLLPSAAGPDGGPGAVFLNTLRRLWPPAELPEGSLARRLLTAGDPMAAMADNERPPADDLVDLLVLLIYAGHHNMVNFLGNALLALASQPEAAATAREPDIMPTAIPELLRFDGPTQFLMLVAREEVVLRGQRIGADDPVLVCIASANRDGAAFAEPDRLDLRRHPNPHLAFGWGAFRCLGARLAEAEAGVALGHLLDRCPALAVVDQDLRWRTVPVVQRGLHRLMVSPRGFA